MEGTIFNGHAITGPLGQFLVQAIVILGFCRMLVVLFRKIKQPAVIAEVIAGILLGPTVISRIPGFTDAIFPASSMTVLNVVAQIGLVLFMYVVGLELDFSIMRRNLRKSFLISLAGERRFREIPWLIALETRVSCRRRYPCRRLNRRRHVGCTHACVRVPGCLLRLLAADCIFLKSVATYRNRRGFCG